MVVVRCVVCVACCLLCVLLVVCDLVFVLGCLSFVG